MSLPARLLLFMTSGTIAMVGVTGFLLIAVNVFKGEPIKVVPIFIFGIALALSGFGIKRVMRSAS